MPARQAMVHRLYLQRNAAARDGYVHKSPPDWQALATVAGRVWVATEETEYDAEVTAVIGRYRGIVPLGTDVTEKDRVEKVLNRADTPTQLFDVMAIDAVIRRKNHVELHLQGHV